MSENQNPNMDEIREIIKRLLEKQEFILDQQSKNDTSMAEMRDKHDADMAEIDAIIKRLLEQQEFILEQQSKYDSEKEETEKKIQFLLNQQEFNLDQQSNHDAEMDEIHRALKQLTAKMSELVEFTGTGFNSLMSQAEEDRQAVRDAAAEIRSDVDRLVNIVENTRDFTQQVARLAVASEKRLTMLENRLS